MPSFYSFPQGFQWGCATSAYQIEGGVSEDGRGQSIWDVYAHTPGKIEHGDNGDTACDHYHRWKEDVALMKTLGMKAYRFSLAWPRILPDGIGTPNKKGLDFYNHLIDELLSKGILPLVTLFHWDLPVGLKDGWLNRATVDAFAEYTGVCVHAFGDRVKNWVTINEPFCASHLGYTLGVQAPGMQDINKGLLAAHHLLLAHGKAVQEIRKVDKEAQVGIALNLSPYVSSSHTPVDEEMLRHADGELNRWFLDPLYRGEYPADMLKDGVKMGLFSSGQPDYVREEDLEIISSETDFLAINYYSRTSVKRLQDGEIDFNQPYLEPDMTLPLTDIGWEIYPQGLFDILTRITREYHPTSILIAENGASYGDAPNSSGRVIDNRRIAYLNSHIQAVGKAIAVGVPVKGYYAWSLMDNFEWSYGYSQRFGLVYVDYATQKRTPKDSAYWYQQVIQHNGITMMD